MGCSGLRPPGTLHAPHRLVNVVVLAYLSFCAAGAFCALRSVTGSTEWAGTRTGLRYASSRVCGHVPWVG